MRYSVIGASVDRVLEVGGKNIKYKPVLKIVFADMIEQQASKLRSMGYAVEKVDKIRPSPVAPPTQVTSSAIYSPSQVLDMIGIDSIRSLSAVPLYGQGYNIAILDSGIRETHEELRGRVVYSQNFTSDPMDDKFNHGTGIASALVATVPLSGILSMKVFDDEGYGSAESVVDAIEECITMHAHLPHLAPSVINLSIGAQDAGNPNDVLRVACRAAAERGIWVVAAAGNDGPEPNTIMTPACDELVIAVGSLNPSTLGISDFSSRGPTEEGLVKPDFLISQSNTCDPRVTHYRAVAQYWDIPLYGYDFIIPQYDADREEIENCIKYNAEEYRGLITFLEKQTGKKMDWDRFDELMQIDYKSRELFREIQQLRKAVPSPMSTREHTTAIVAWYWFTCDPATVDYFTKIRNEVKEWVDNKIGYLPEEKYRIFWLGGIPPYHTLELYNYFDGYGAASAFETVYQFHREAEEREDPLENLASRLMFTHMNDQAGAYYPQDWVRNKVDDYKIDGIVAHQIMGCRQVTVGVKACIEKLREYKEIPALFIPGDQVDMRDYSDPNTRANMANFMDALATSKERRR